MGLDDCQHVAFKEFRQETSQCTSAGGNDVQKFGTVLIVRQTVLGGIESFLDSPESSDVCLSLFPEVFAMLSVGIGGYSIQEPGLV